MNSIPYIAREPHRLLRDQRTLSAMVALYCQSHHHTSELCTQCQSLVSYAWARLESCPHGDNKPTCARCPVHCYAPHFRQEVRLVMHYAGPRMLWKAPIATMLHMMDNLLTRLGYLGRYWTLKRNSFKEAGIS